MLWLFDTGRMAKTSQMPQGVPISAMQSATTGRGCSSCPSKSKPALAGWYSSTVSLAAHLPKPEPTSSNQTCWDESHWPSPRYFL